MLKNIHDIIAGDYTGLKIKLILIIIFQVIMIIAVLIDLWIGTERAKKCGEKMKSSKLRWTVNKIGDYWRLMIFGLFIDIVLFIVTPYVVPFGTMVFMLGSCFIEGKSVIESLRRKKSAAAEVPQAAIDIIKNIGIEQLSGYIETLKKLNNKKDNDQNS